LAPIDEFFATSYTYHNPSMPEVKDLSSVKEFNAVAYRAFPDIRFTIEDMVRRETRWFTVARRAALTKVTSWDSLQPENRSLSRASSFRALLTANFKKTGKAWM
jgi:hypothetical protein